MVGLAAVFGPAVTGQAAVVDISGALAHPLDTVVGAGNSARLTANATTYWGSTTAVSNVDLNGFQFTIHNGGGNAQYYNGALTGPGTLRFEGRGDATWTPDIRLGGTAANTPAGVTIAYGRVQLNKTEGVDALAGAITVNTSQTVRIQWLKSHQIHDAATLTSTAGSGAFHLDMGGFSETIGGLDMKTGHLVNTGLGGVLNVATLTVGGVSQPKGAYTASSGFVTGTGYIDVDNFGPPVIDEAPGVPSGPTPADGTNTIHPAVLSQLSWAVASDATSYDVYLWLASETKPATPTANVLLTGLAVNPQVLSLETYNWQVVAKNDIGNTPGPEWTFSTVDRTLVPGNTGVPYSDATHNLNYIVGVGNSGTLQGDFTLFYSGSQGSFSVPVNTNGFILTADTGGGNGGHVASGAISGAGSFVIIHAPHDGGLWSGNYTISGSAPNTYSGGTSIRRGQVRMAKTAGVDALPATLITLGSGGNTARLIWGASDQVNDLAEITVALPTVTNGAAPDANLNFLDLGDFSDTIASLVLADGGTKTQVRIGEGAVLTVTNLTVAGELKAPGTYTSVNGFVVGLGSVVVPGATAPADAANSTVTASASSVVADGINTSTITVTLKDSGGSGVPGKSVTLASSRGASDMISAASGTSNASGVVTFTVSSTTVGSPVFTATVTTDSVVVSETASVSFTANPAASAGQSTVVATPPSVVANGSSSSTITVTVMDSGTAPVAGKTVTLASNRGANDTISAASGVSNLAGEVTFTVTSLTVGDAILTAAVSDDSITVTQTATVTFTAPANVVDISNAIGPLQDGGIRIDTVVPVGYSGRLVGTTQTYWASGGFSRALDLNGNSLIIDSGGGNAMTASGAISGNGLVRVNAGGIGVLHINGAVGNTYTGTTEINNGPVKLGKTSGNALNGSISVSGSMSNSFPGTGTVWWGANNQINDSSNLTLATGSSLNLGGFADTMGSLSLTGDASVYLGEATSMARFANSSAASWTAGKQLIIRDWNGSPTGGGAEGIFFGNSASGLSANQVANTGFMNPAGLAAGLYHAAILATGEVVPTGTPVEAISPPYDLSEAATAARAAIYTSSGRAELTAIGSPLETGTRMVFFGDSITWQNTYIGMLNTAIAGGAGTQGKTITLINRGINGGGVLQVRDGSADSGYPGSVAQASFASLLTSDQADIAVVFIGINDVGWRNTPAATYEQGLRDLAATAEAQGVTLIFATPAARNESPVGAGGDDAEIDQFSAIVQTVASDTGSTFVDLRSAFVAYWQNHNYEIRLDGSFVTLKPYGLLTYDGVHPTNLGNQMIADHMADGILAALTVPVVSAFETWALENAGGQSASEDFDHDGVANGVEYFMGEIGSSPTINPPVVSVAGVSSVTWPRNPDAVAAFKVQHSANLIEWTDVLPPHASIDESDPNEVTYTLPGGSPSRFCRLVVTP